VWAGSTFFSVPGVGGLLAVAGQRRPLDNLSKGCTAPQAATAPDRYHPRQNAAAVHGLPLREAALDLVRTFHLEPAPDTRTEKRHG
jgi:hypothetical protein